LLVFSLFAVAQPAAVEHGPVLNVLDSGAHNDGSADAAGAFRAAIAAAQRVGGGTV
jgi:polygalacturonase